MEINLKGVSRLFLVNAWISAVFMAAHIKGFEDRFSSWVNDLPFQSLFFSSSKIYVLVSQHSLVVELVVKDFYVDNTN